MEERKMKKAGFTLLVLGILGLGIRHLGFAEPSPDALRGTIRDYVVLQEKLQGAFAIVDERNGGLRQLELVRVHDRVGKTGDYYYSCTDMKDVNNGDLLDLDFDIEDQNGNLKVVDIRIHKDNGKPRYTYDENDNMIPVKE
jgi:hypothetical protein